jgi:hypothetical protein
VLEYPFQTYPTLSKQTTQQKIELERLKLQLNEKKENDLFKLETEELIQIRTKFLSLELDNTTLTKEILTLKSTV